LIIDNALHGYYKIYFISLIPNTFRKGGREVVAPIPLKLVRAFSEESHSVNTIRQVFFVIANFGIGVDDKGWG
jgi:hypothetical protein